MRTRVVSPLGGSCRPAKKVVEPHPATAAATTKAPAALNQKLLVFKIPYLEGERGACRRRNAKKSTTTASSSNAAGSTVRNRFHACLDSRSITKQPSPLARPTGVP